MNIWKYVLGVSLGVFGLGAGLGCGGSDSLVKGADDVVEEEETSGGTDCRQDGVEVVGLLGSVDQEEVERVFERNMKGLFACYESVVEDLEEIEGSLEIALQVDPSGAVVEANLPHSDLGSLEAERCILNKTSQFEFRRSGCGIAYVNKELSFEAPYDPEPLQWGRVQVAETIYEHAYDVERCLNGETGIDVVIYVGKGGVVWSSGAAAESFAKREAARCLATACRRWTFKDPGDDLAKVRLNF